MPYNVMKATALLSILIEENFVVILSANVLYNRNSFYGTAFILEARPYQSNNSPAPGRNLLIYHFLNAVFN